MPFVGSSSTQYARFSELRRQWTAERKNACM
jgi:hypothetical protein